METGSDNFILHQAIKDNKLDEIKLLLKDGTSVNDPVLTTGPFAGFTALHFACMEINWELVKLLVKDYKANVNVMAEDQVQPIHLACFNDPPDKLHFHNIAIVTILSKAGANVNAELGEEMFLKYNKDGEWCSDFGSKMSLLAYAIIYKKQFLSDELTRFEANGRIISLTNKTLVMYALEDFYYTTTMRIVSKIKDPEFINFRDNDGVPATHYFLHPKKYGDFRYDSDILFDVFEEFRGDAIEFLIRAGADINALINDDPSTFLLNMAAYRSCPNLLQILLPLYTSMSFSKPLYYATLPVDEQSDKYLCVHLDDMGSFQVDDFYEELRNVRKKCTKLILKDLVNRRTFGFPVNEEEIKLLDKLIATDIEIKGFVRSYELHFIRNKMNNLFIELSDKKMTVYEFITHVFDSKKLKILAKDNTLWKAWSQVRVAFSSNDDEDDIEDSQSGIEYFQYLIIKRINHAIQRSQLLQEVKKLSKLTEAIPLPYEIILDIIEYLPNEDLQIFIQAFFSQ